jgi:hypothetical protein
MIAQNGSLRDLGKPAKDAKPKAPAKGEDAG